MVNVRRVSFSEEVGKGIQCKVILQVGRIVTRWLGHQQEQVGVKHGLHQTTTLETVPEIADTAPFQK
jgi:hypothetical protein